MIFVVLEEVYSIAPDGSERQLVRRSQKPLFAGDRRTAYSFAKSRAAGFDAAGNQADARFPYFSARGSPLHHPACDARMNGRDGRRIS
jgi:hypothetical protein